MDHSGDASDDRVGALLGAREFRMRPDLAAAVGAHRAGGDLGATEVDADHEPGFAHRINKLLTAWAICVATSSRMHSQCPSGQTSGPCGEQGRHLSASFPAVA